MDGPKPNDIARCLNALALMNMQDIASADNISDLVNDYFITRPIGNDESDSDLCESSDNDCECDPELDLVLDEEVNGSVNGASGGVDTATCGDGLEHLADIIVTWDHAGDGPETVSDFRVTCSCKLIDGQPCHTRYTPEELADVRLQYFSMTHDELDIAVLAKLSCGMHLTSMTTQSRNFYHHGFRICRDVFKSLHDISQDKLTRLITHYKVAGVEARVYRNKRKRPANALKFDVTHAVVNFVVNYAEANAILLPGRTPGHWKSDVKLLPTNCTKKTVYMQYCGSVDAAGTRKVLLRTFRRLWHQLLPFIVTMRPATDLCWHCQKGVTKLARSANLPEAEKSAAVRDYEDHLRRATMERSCYTQVCKAAKNALPPGVTLGRHAACSFTGKAHYSFDFALQVHYPSDPLQPGPIYFKCPRKCGLFGVACEAFPKQVNFLLDESVHTGKGANTVVSMLHYFFDHYGVDECGVHLHADNCSGQNKNSCMMQYLMWRVLQDATRTPPCRSCSLATPSSAVIGVSG